MKLLDNIRDGVRRWVRVIASALNTLTGGKLSPNAVTIVGLLAHIPIAWLIATGSNNLLAAGLLVIFGLFDVLDGELARLQKRASNAGMLLDATTDRMKEVILYMGIAAAFTHTTYAADPVDYYLAATIAALGGSMLVSYVKAKGETAVAGKGITANEANRLFQDGLMRFEVRMFILILGLITSWLLYAVVIVAILSWLTAFGRLIKISRKLNRV